MSTTRYQKNFNGTMPFSNTDYMMLLEASTALSFTVPGSSSHIYRAEFRCQYGAEVWVCLNGTATLPTSNTVTPVTNQEFLPLREPKYVKGGDTLSFISLTTPQVGVSLLQVQDIA
jgi:hypothetical protein